MKRPIGILVGSLRRQSLSRQLAQALIALAPNALALEIIDISGLPHFNADDEESPPASTVEFKRRLSELQGVLFVSPEYNRGVPGFLKNAIDIASRPYGESAWEGKPAAVISLSPGALGGFGANHQLRQSFVALNMPAMPVPEAYIGDAERLFNEQGELVDESVIEFMREFLREFGEWTLRHAPLAA